MYAKIYEKVEVAEKKRSVSLKLSRKSNVSIKQLFKVVALNAYSLILLIYSA